LGSVTGEFSLVLAVSVLHHIPDYLAFLRAVQHRLTPGGAVLTIQDPLRYSRMSAVQHRTDRLAYLTWRLGQGKLRTGMASLSRRMRHALDESKPGDMVEYHVMRDGVDEVAIDDELATRFDSVEVLRYWSNQSRAGQQLGDRLGWANTFCIRALGYHP
jgi:hypothetical protein